MVVAHCGASVLHTGASVAMRKFQHLMGLLVIASATCAGGCRRPVTASAVAPPEVYVATVVEQDVPEYLNLVGQTDGYQDVDIRARVEGFLESVDFREGSFVRAGDLLYRIDRKPLEAELAGAVADKATAEARLTKTMNDVARYTPLVSKQAVSRQELDDARSAEQAARSQVAAASAAVEKAKLDLSYTSITSPIAGLVGITRFHPGNLVGRGEATLLTTVSQIDPILFKVGITEADFLRVARRYPERVGEVPRAMGIELTLADGTRHRYSGHIRTFERAVNPLTGTLGVQIEFPNTGYVLRPGQYGRAQILIDVKKNARLVPQRAVQEVQNEYSVAVVNAEGKVTFRSVKVGDRLGTLWVVDEGVSPGERVVAEGLQRVQDGTTVRTKPYEERAEPVEGVAN